MISVRIRFVSIQPNSDPPRRYSHSVHYIVVMAGISACAGMRRIGTFGVSPCGASHEMLTCSMSTPVSRQGLHVRHLGSNHSLGSYRSLDLSRSDRLRPAVPRQGRLLCQAAKQSQVSIGDEHHIKVVLSVRVKC